MKLYKVLVTREGGSWLADVPDVPGAHTFARSLDGLHKSVREVILLMDDLEDDAEIAMVFDYHVGDQVVVEAAKLGRDRADLAARNTELQGTTARVIRELSGSGYSVRDAARLLEMTPGRVSQLVNS